MLKFTFTLSMILIFSSISLACGDRNLSEFNPIGNNITDDAPAFRAALDSLAACGGGTLNVPTGKFRVSSSVIKDFKDIAAKIIIRGNGPSSQIHIATGGLADAFRFENVVSVIERLMFVGGGVEGAQTDDALNVLHIWRGRTTIQDNLFVGIGSISPGAATIRITHGAIAIVENNRFWACRSHSAQSPFTGTVLGDDYGGLKVESNEFLDFTPSLINGLFYETGHVAGMAWVILLNPYTADVLRTPQVVINDNEFDEGAFCAVVTTSSVQLQSMTLNRNKLNVGVGCGYSLRNIKYLEIDGGLAGLHNGGNPVDAIQLFDVKYPTIKNFVTAPTTFANRLRVDSGTIMLRMIDSKFAQIINNAQAWRIEDGPITTSFPAAKPIRKL